MACGLLKPYLNRPPRSTQWNFSSQFEPDISYVKFSSQGICSFKRPCASTNGNESWTFSKMNMLYQHQGDGIIFATRGSAENGSAKNIPMH